MKKEQTEIVKKKNAKSIMNIDYKDPVSLYKYVADGGKIVPARISKLKICQQRMVNKAVKKSRNLALLPIGMGHFDSLSKIEQISVIPFDF